FVAGLAHRRAGRGRPPARDPISVRKFLSQFLQEKLLHISVRTTDELPCFGRLPPALTHSPNLLVCEINRKDEIFIMTVMGSACVADDKLPSPGGYYIRRAWARHILHPKLLLLGDLCACHQF